MFQRSIHLGPKTYIHPKLSQEIHVTEYQSRCCSTRRLHQETMTQCLRVVA